ncbi:serine hydrolase [Granulicella sp. S156]|uniref:serine hydrolase domain-containing protein n=1 Tax=Granulicella sp. S156 TaxID=1747224 RepID=UPI00131ACFD2|nr:serine hydrolase domain-containing protein [Granulicella sp. S156]
MMRLHRTAILFASFLVLTGWWATSGSAQTNTQPVRTDEPIAAMGLSDMGKASLSRQISSAVSRGDTPGVVALVVGCDSVLYEGAAGKLDVAHDTAMPVNAILSIASMTKPVTSVAIMMLFDEGKLKLDDPVSKYLAGFDNLRVITTFNEKDATYETRPAKRPMTIRHLLTHTSGIGYGFANPIEYRLTEVTKKNEWELPLLNDPGDRWNYGPSTTVLGMIVEKITGEPLETYFQQHIFEPLGMVDTSYAVQLAKQSRVATKYSRINGLLQEQPRRPIPATPKPPFLGEGGLYSTAQDYGRFIQMLLNGGHLGPVKILSESSVKMMGENNIGSIFVELQPAADRSLAKPFPLGAGHDKFGLGFEIASGDPQYAKFRSAGSMSWAGIYNTEFWIDPLQHIGGVMMMQVSPFYDDGALRTLRDFEELVYQDLRSSGAAPGEGSATSKLR